MAKDCLLTKLKSSINDDSLPKLGELKFEFDLTDQNVPNFGLQVTVFSDKGHSYLSVKDDAIITVGGEQVSNPYDYPMESSTTTLVTYPGHNKIEASLSNKYALFELIIRGASNISFNFDAVKYLGNINRFGLYFAYMEGSLLDLIPLCGNKLVSLCIDTPKKVQDGDIRQFMNEMAINGNVTTFIDIAVRKGTAYSNGITDVPKVFDGTYMGRYSRIYVTNDTTTYPHGWYGKRPDNKWFNANDEEIQAPQ